MVNAMNGGWEGCLSVPGMRGFLPRFTHIRYQGFDQFGHSIEREVDGFHARVVRHNMIILIVFYIQNVLKI